MKYIVVWLYCAIIISLIFTAISVKESSSSQIEMEEKTYMGNKIMHRSITEEELAKLSEDQRAEYRRIQKPLASKLMPRRVVFLNNLLSKVHRKAEIEFNPRFLEAASANAKFNSMFPEDTRQVGVPVNREALSDETTIPINNAWSNSVYTFKFLWWWTTYPASNAIYGQNYWCSSGGHGENDIIIWEAQFNELTRVHGINIIWAYAPKRYAIEFSIDGTNYKTLVLWRDAITGGSSSWWSNLIPALKQASKSFPDRITFDNPVFALKIRILMKGPVNYYFGLYRVDLYVKNWTMVIKSQSTGQCKEDCWVVNTVNPKNAVPVKLADCVASIGYSENRELFTLLYDSRIIHFNSGLCVISGYDKNVVLEDCNVSESANDGRHKFNFHPDGRISPRYAPDECIHKPEKAISSNIVSTALAEATSESADGGHNAGRTIDDNMDTYWSSNPGDSVCTLTLYFKQWESMDDLIIHWKYLAKNFDVFAFTLEQGWKMILRVKDNTIPKNTLKLGRINARAVQIKMTKNQDKFIGLPVYGLSKVEISDGSVELLRAKCDGLKQDSKIWTLDDQFYYFVGNKKPYMEAYNNLSATYLKLKKLNRLINTDFILAEKAIKKAGLISKLLETTNKSMNELLIKIKQFKTESYAKKNVTFEGLLIKYKQDFFFPYIQENTVGDKFPIIKDDDLVPQLGAVFTNPGRDCWHIKQLIPQKKSGYYWIKPRCSPKPLRVFCDYSIDGLGISIMIWHSEATINTEILDVKLKSVKDVQMQCAKLGLYPIEINNTQVVDRITQYVEVLGYDLSKPYVIPLGYDWGCPDGKCTLTYKSMNAKQTKPLSQFFPTPDKEIWNNNRLMKYNTIGLGYSGKGQPFYFNMDSARITAIVCSTNEHIPPISDPLEAVLQCSDILSGNAKIEGSVGTKIKVFCPDFCLEKSQHPVHGRETYSDNSSICKAAIHAGKIKNHLGGSIMIVIGGKRDNYGSSTQNGVKTLAYNNYTNKSFTIEALDDLCPIDYFISDEDELIINANTKAVESETSSSDEVTAPKKTAVPLPEVKKVEFDGNVTGKPASFDPPRPKPTPESKKNKEGGLNWNFFSFVEENSEDFLDNENGLFADLEVANSKSSKAKNERSNETEIIETIEKKEGKGKDKEIVKLVEEVEKKDKGASEKEIIEEVEIIEEKKKKKEHDHEKEKKEFAEFQDFKKIEREKEKEKEKELLLIKEKAKEKALIEEKKKEKEREERLNLLKTDPVKALEKVTEAIGKGDSDSSQIQNKLSEALNNNQVKDKINEAKLSADPKINPAEEKEKIQNAEKESCVISTDVFVREIVDYRGKDYQDFKYFDKFGLSMKNLINEFKSEYSFGIYPSKLSNKHFEITFDKLTKIANYLDGFYEKIKHKGTERVTNTENTIDKFNKKLASYSESKPFKTDYSAKLEEIFEIFSYKLVVNFPGVWKSVNSNLGGRSNAIHQISPIYSQNRIGTLINPKGRRFYDFIYKVDVMTRDKGTFGVIFRMIDPFNFLAFEISIAEGYKRVVKMSNGNKYIIKSLSDGGISQNDWFKVLVRAQRNKFVIRFGQAKKYANYNAAPIVFEFEDISYPKGKVGLFTNGNRDFYFDMLDVTPIPCQLPWEANRDLPIVTNTSSVYLENWSLTCDLKYDFTHPNKFNNGASKWEFKSNRFDRETVLLQNSLNEDVSDDKEGTKAILKRVVIKSKSVIDYQFLVTNQGIVGCIFKYINPDNYYAFEIGGGDDVSKRFFQLRKKVEGSFSILKRYNLSEEISSVPFFGYELNTWYAIRIEINEQSIKVSGSLLGQTAQVLIFNESDNALVYGRVGFSTTGTRAAFSEILIRPLPIPFSDKPLSEQVSPVVIEEDVLLVKYFDNSKEEDMDKANADKDKKKENDPNDNKDKSLPKIDNKIKGKPWKVCATTTSPESRNEFCKVNFGLSKVAEIKCNKNFCGTCCHKFVPHGHSITMHACEKICLKDTKPSKPNDSQKIWESECIQNSNSERNIYNYCDTTFSGNDLLSRTCKLDTCRLCCATHDQTMPFTSASLPSEKQCFKACVNKFPDVNSSRSKE